MKILILVLSCVSFAASAAEKKSDIQSLQSEFLALKYEIKADRKKGRVMMLNVLAQFQRFYPNRNKPNSLEQFRSLVGLVSASLPYDQGTEAPKP